MTHAGQGMRNTGPGTGAESTACVTLRQGTQVTGLEAQQRSSLLGHKGPGACQWRGTQLAAAGASFLLSQRPVCFLPPPSCLFGCQRVGVSQRSGTQGTTHYRTSSHLGQGLGPSPCSGRACQAPRSPVSEAAVSSSVGWARAGNFPLS